eukprot:11045800-Karenia_brevis.AAC.1
MEKREHSRKLLRKFIQLAEHVLLNGGHVSFEWPRQCTGWLLPELTSFIKKWNLYSVNVDGCRAGVKSSAESP